MSIYGIGIDICEISRVEKSLNKYSNAFLKRILHPEERKHYEKHPSKKNFVAKRFAAKEAFSKAFGTGISDGLTFPEIEIVHDKLGKPFFNLHGVARLKIKSLARDVKVHLSISDEKKYAVAQVVIEIND